MKNKLYSAWPAWKCQGCSQNLGGECRAYIKPESKEEYESRKVGLALCQPTSIASEVCPPYTPPKERCAECGCVLLDDGDCPNCDTEVEDDAAV